MPWKSGFFVSRSATHRYMGTVRASWLASECLHVPVCGGTPQRDGAERNRAAWQNGDRTERYGAAPGTKNKAEEDESDENL